jgi:hypothetical protein
MAKTPKRPRDPNQLAKLMIDIATGEASDETPEPSPAAKSGSEGGKKRAANMTPERRKEIAQNAAAKRWNN